MNAFKIGDCVTVRQEAGLDSVFSAVASKVIGIDDDMLTLELCERSVQVAADMCDPFSTALAKRKEMKAKLKIFFKMKESKNILIGLDFRRRVNLLWYVYNDDICETAN